MRLRFPCRSRLDSQGRIRVNAAIRIKLGLRAGGPVEFYINDVGQLAFRAAKPKFVKKRPIYD